MDNIKPSTSPVLREVQVKENKPEARVGFNSLSEAWNADIPSQMSIPTSCLTALVTTSAAILPVAAPLIVALVFPEGCADLLALSWEWFPVATAIGSVGYLYPAVKRCIYCKNLGNDFCMDMRELSYRTTRVLDTGVRQSFNYLTS